MFLEEQRASGQSPAWADAYLGTAVPLYRPDIDEPAYWEFQVLVAQAPTGFMVLATNSHDYPITNWSTAGPGPTGRLRQAATAAGETAVRFFKLDILSYAAENAAGELVARDGELPLTYVVNLLRGVWFRESWAAHTTDIVILLGVMVVGLTVAALTFRWE
jgi:hypothetical protein